MAENSRSAFKAAVAKGFGIELDVQLSADGRAVVFHDTTLDRLTGQSGQLRDLTLAELEQIRLASSDDHIAGLAATLELVGERVPLLVEIKDSGRDNHRIAEAVDLALTGYSGAVAVMSFAPDVVAWFRDNAPATVRGLVASTRYRRELGWKLSRPQAHEALARDLEPDFVAYDIRSLPNAFTTGWRRHGRPLLTWTVRTGEQRRKARRFADNIIFEMS